MRLHAQVSAVAWWLGLLGACGGADFTTAGVDASNDSPASAQEGGGTAEASSADANAADGTASSVDGKASPPDGDAPNGVKCGPTVCSGLTPVCCTAGLQCAHVQCGCETQLECARDLDCPALLPVCCINTRQDVPCAAGHFVASCATACRNGGLQMCDPAGSQRQCLNGQCSNDSGDLSNVGLPAGSGFGVCK